LSSWPRAAGASAPVKRRIAELRHTLERVLERRLEAW
jgi:hypothetical protein